MPVLGHAFVGLATARYTQPGQTRGLAASLWAPLVIALAYLPDLIAQAGGLAGVGLRVPAHSVLVAIPVGALLGLLIGRWMQIPVGQAVGVAWVAILSHDLLDLLQSTDRIPFWPLWNRPPQREWTLIPTDPYRESILFIALFVAFLVIQQIRAGRHGGQSIAGTDSHTGPVRGRMTGITATVLILGAALGTHYLRTQREQQHADAKALLEARQYRAALLMIDEAERFPSTAQPGRTDYLRAAAWDGIGDRTKAERLLLSSIEKNPWYFWAVADLAVLSASSDASVAERREKVRPWQDRLEKDFATHPALSRVLDRINRKLATPTTRSTSQPAAEWRSIVPDA